MFRWVYKFAFTCDFCGREYTREGDANALCPPWWYTRRKPHDTRVNDNHYCSQRCLNESKPDEAK